jgi:hypothetical protein
MRFELPAKLRGQGLQTGCFWVLGQRRQPFCPIPQPQRIPGALVVWGQPPVAYHATATVTHDCRFHGGVAEAAGAGAVDGAGGELSFFEYPLISF